MELKNFFTEIKFDKFPFAKIEKNSVLAGIGSCFAEKFLTSLREVGMSVAINPSGIIYNLHSMNEIIERVLTNKKFSADEVNCVNDRYILWSHHGSFGGDSVNEVLSSANQALTDFREQLSKADYLILTPSSSVVYRHLKLDKIVGNCHKENNNEFQVEVLSSTENCRLLQNILNTVFAFNPKCRVIVSLSPIRHYPGNLVLNSRSKANLLSGIHEALMDFPSQAVYFPAYEIAHDELRDYRFYDKDMLHLSEVGEEYILNKFIDWSVSDACCKFITDSIKRQKLANHRPKFSK